MATLNLSFQIDDAKVAGIKDDFSSYLGWKATLPAPTEEDPNATIPNPETQNAFIKRKLGEYVKTIVKDKRLQDAMKQSNVDAESDILLT